MYVYASVVVRRPRISQISQIRNNRSICLPQTLRFRLVPISCFHLLRKGLGSTLH